MSHPFAGEPGGLTVLVPDDGYSASKHYQAEPDGSYTKLSDYHLGKLFHVQPLEAKNLRDLHGIIRDFRTYNVVIVRGALDDEYFERTKRNPEYRIARRKNQKNDGHLAHFVEVPRLWLMIDIDHYPLPPNIDLQDDPDAIVRKIIAEVLPPEFQDACCVYQWSNSAGMVPGIAKLHLFFWLDRPWSNTDLRRWKREFAPCVDHAPFNAVQPHYIADPQVTGGPDPIAERIGWLDGSRNEVTLPALPERTKRDPEAPHTVTCGRTTSLGLNATSMAEALALLGDGEGREGFHAPLLAATMQYAQRCFRGGRRNDDECKATLRDAVQNATRRPERDITGYLADDYLHRIIEGAFRLIENAEGAMPDEDDTVTTDFECRMPNGYGMTRHGLFYTSEQMDKDGNRPNPVWLCDAFSVRGRCSSDQGEGWGLVIGWQDEGGWPHQWIVRRDTLHSETHKIASTLDHMGLQCSIFPSRHNLLAQFFARVRPALHLTVVDRGGWYGEQNYLLPTGEVIGTADLILRSEQVRHDATCASRGTLAEWNEHVGHFCVGNSRLALLASCALAGPLLSIVDEPCGGLHIYGGSQKGKSTAGFVCASVGGKGSRDGKVQQWRATGNGLEAIAARASDGFMVLDEISQADAKEAGDICYMLANGQGKQRMTAGATARALYTWRLIFVSTGEVTLSQRMMEAGRTAMTGMEIRLIDIPMDGGKGMGLFENLHGFEQPAEFSQHLQATSARYYGVGMRSFLEKLVEERSADPNALYEKIKRLRQDFVRRHVPDGSDGQVRSVAARFGVIAAAGEMAIEYRVFDWPAGEAEQACARCFNDWLAARGGNGAGEDQKGIAQVRRFLELHGNARFQKIVSGLPASAPQWKLAVSSQIDDDAVDNDGYETRIPNQAGYKRHEERVNKETGEKTQRWWFMFTPEVWKAEVCQGLNADLVARAIKEQGWLDCDHSHLTKKVRVPKLDKAQRLYCVSSDILL
jgi:uncharacterized protein (DUF927 family)